MADFIQNLANKITGFGQQTTPQITPQSTQQITPFYPTKTGSPIDVSKNIPGNVLGNGTKLVSGATIDSTPTDSLVKGIDASTTSSMISDAINKNQALSSQTTPNINQSVKQPETLSETEKEIARLNKELGYEATDTAELRKGFDFTGSQKQLADLNNQYAITKAKYDNLYQKTGSQNIPTGFVSGQLAIERSAAATELGGIAAQIQAVQGNINSANKIIEDTINQKYAPIQKNYDNLIKYYTEIEKPKLADKVAEKKAKLDAEQEQIKEAQSKVQDAINNGVDSGTAYKALGELLAGKIKIDEYYNKIGVEQPGTSNTTGGTVAQRTNNPGNIKWGDFAQSMGAVDSGIKALDGGTFAKFPDEQSGTTAQLALLRSSKYSNLTLDEAMKKWSNNGYGADVSPNIPKDTLMKNLTSDQISQLQKDMAKREGFYDKPISNSIETSLNNTQTNEQFLSKLSPSDASLVKKIANYEMDISKVTSLRGNERTRIAKLVSQYDPTFDMNNYAARAKVRSDFTSGKNAQNIRSLNTAVGHLDTLSKAANALENSSLILWNKIANKGLNYVGDPRVTQFNTAATAVEGELASVFKGTGATDQEIKVWRENLNASQSPEQLKAAIDTAIELMGSRLNALQSQYETGLGKPKDFTFLNDKSRAILTNLGIDVSALDPVTNQTTSNQRQIINYQGKNYSVDENGDMTPL